MNREERIRAAAIILRDAVEELRKAEQLPAQSPPPTKPTPRLEIPLRPGEVEHHYPVAEVARLLGMSRQWVYDRLADGTFITANFGTGKSKKRIPASSINAYIEAHTYRRKQ